MGRSVEKSGRTVDDAIAAALGELELTIDDVHVDVLNEGKAGLLGLLSGKQARVRVSELEDDERVPQPGYEGAGALPYPVRKAAPVRDDNALNRMGDAINRNGAAAEPAAADGADAADGFSDEDDENAALGAAAYSDAAHGVDFGERGGAGFEDDGDMDQAAYEYDNDINRAIDFLEVIFKGIHISAGMHAESTDEGFLINVESDDSGILIGHRGETLDAIQYLMNLYMNKGRSKYIRVTVDVEDYKKKREAALIRIAGQMADKVVRLRRNFTLDAMNSYERRIIHSTLQNHPKVETYSVGEDPNRKVVVTLKNRGGYSSR